MDAKMIGLENDIVKLSEYKQSWIEYFEKEKKLLREKIGYQVKIEHIGSTSVPGMIAKPIIDILIGIKSLDEIGNYIEPMNELGYEYKGEAGVPGRHFFRKGNGKVSTHHVHFVKYKSDNWNRHLKFRNLLRTNELVSRKYYELKKRLADTFSENRPLYTDSKSDFITIALRCPNNIITVLDELKSCTICPRNCEIDRWFQKGYCKSGVNVKINLWQKHFGEEPVLSGSRGSGTIFFSNCNLGCVFCQNYQISQLGWGKEYSIGELADIMLELQESEAHNINLVSPTHYALQIREAIILAKEKGLKIPIVWNSNAYEKVETLSQLSGLVDIYLPDFKYFSDVSAKKYSDAENYPEIAKKAIKEMFRQVGHLQIDKNGIAVKGLLIRLLVLPENKNQTENILRWIAETLGKETYISLMSQYYPTYRASEFPEINRSLTPAEYQETVEILETLGFENGFVQELEITPEWTPRFKK